QDDNVRNSGPRISRMRYLACTDPDFSQRLYGVVEDETAGLATGSAGHIDLFVDFAKAWDSVGPSWTRRRWRRRRRPTCTSRSS
ncbi:MAG: hypothetical protein ACHQ7M_21015, partial [Chloroflexota bacterium]